MTSSWILLLVNLKLCTPDGICVSIMIWSDQVDLLVLLLDFIFTLYIRTQHWIMTHSCLPPANPLLDLDLADLEHCSTLSTACCRVIASTGPLQAHSLQVTHLCIAVVTTPTSYNIH